MASAFEQNLTNKQLISQSISGIRESGRNIQEAFQRGEELKQKQKETRRSALLDLVKTGASVAMPFIQEKYLAPMQDERALAQAEKLGQIQYNLTKKSQIHQNQLNEQFRIWEETELPGGSLFAETYPERQAAIDAANREREVLDALVVLDTRYQDVADMELRNDMERLRQTLGIEGDAEIDLNLRYLTEIELSDEQAQVTSRAQESALSLYRSQREVDVGAAVAQETDIMALWQDPEYRAHYRAQLTLEVERIGSVGRAEIANEVALLYQRTHAESLLFLEQLQTDARGLNYTEILAHETALAEMRNRLAKEMVDKEWAARLQYDKDLDSHESADSKDPEYIATTGNLIKGFGLEQSFAYQKFYTIGADGQTLVPDYDTVTGPEDKHPETGVQYTEEERHNLWYAAVMEHTMPTMEAAFSLYTSVGEWEDSQLQLLRELIFVPTVGGAGEMLALHREHGPQQTIPLPQDLFGAGMQGLENAFGEGAAEGIPNEFKGLLWLTSWFTQRFPNLLPTRVTPLDLQENLNAQILNDSSRNYPR